MPRVGLGIMLLILLIMTVVSLTVGAASISVAEVVSALMGRGVSPVHETIIKDIRLPRTLLAILVGAGVATSGKQPTPRKSGYGLFSGFHQRAGH